MEAELKNVLLKTGDQLKVQGKIHVDAKRFQIDLGSSSSELALHFNPRFHDGDINAPLLVCNSLCDGIWDQEQRDSLSAFQPGSKFKVLVKHTGKQFEVKLPDGQMVEFPNRQEVEVISYIRVKGDISLTSFKIY
ncbi:galectin-1-like isoform X4 [Electrophorus electricus]|uniref:Galectin n=1 Tax=Electrophorus electricus TaxID=8005 RepID=A0A4W4GX43_ELEEL|nr:galectin-1-like isoform X2 [Electrophorus electricus]XP_026856830.1 galectin-1-like isoform X3 [Electrophorus electricus]XP_026856831.1 galectin-1-like isoform X4 [Electrophorus electricus]